MVQIYGLIDPVTHVVRYVGQTSKLNARYRAYVSGKDQTTGAWVRSLPQPPHLVVFDTVEQKRVPRKRFAATAQATKYVHVSIIAETKWIKRFRRTLLNQKMRSNSASTWDWLVNPDEK